MSFIYLSMPWAKLNPESRRLALIHSMEVSAFFIRNGDSIYHPIQFGAGVERFLQDTNQSPIPHETWLQSDIPFLAAANSMIVLAEIDGWRESAGVSYEIAYMDKTDKMVWYLYRNTGPGRSTTPFQLQALPREVSK